jgi:TolB-like protein/Tfp pilus assembly protein PilF
MARTEPTTPQLRLLGGIELRGRDGAVATPRGNKAKALLACLALAAGEPWPRRKLMGLLWSDRGAEQARDSLRQALAELRRAFDEPSPLIADNHAVAFDPGFVVADAVAFERLVAAGHPAEACALYRGALLDGLAVNDPAFAAWLAAERQRLHAMFLRALAESMAGAWQAGDREAAAEAARRLLEQDPLHEAACRTLMLALAARGQRAQALSLYDGVCERLGQRGTEPEPATSEVHERIRRQGTVAAEAESRPSIAVLPFANLSGREPDQDYFGDGMTEDITTDLAQISALFVAARHSAFTLKGKSISAPDAARALGVRYVLEGSVRMAERRVRITAQLIDGATGGHVWAKRYDRDLGDVFAVQDEIARSIAGALSVELLPGETAAIGKRTTENAEAYQYYLMGRWFLMLVGDKRAFRVARQMFAKAIDIDPNYARAHAGIATSDCFLLLTSDPGLSFDGIFASSARALALAPELAEAHAAKGVALDTAGRFEEATAAFEQAMRLDPDSFDTHFFYGRTCLSRGLPEQAIRLFERAAELQPKDFRALAFASMEYKKLGRLEAERSAMQRCLERVEAEVKVRPDNASALSIGACALAEFGRNEQAEAWAARAAIIDPDDCYMRYNIGCVYVRLGRLDTALDHFEHVLSKTTASVQWYLQWMKQDSDLDPLRSHPRFQAMVASSA